MEDEERRSKDKTRGQNLFFFRGFWIKIKYRVYNRNLFRWNEKYQLQKTDVIIDFSENRFGFVFFMIINANKHGIYFLRIMILKNLIS